MSKHRGRGLPYGWWKNPDFWAGFIGFTILFAFGMFLLWAWFQ